MRYFLWWIKITEESYSKFSGQSSKGNGRCGCSIGMGLDEPLLDPVLDIDGGVTSMMNREGSGWWFGTVSLTSGLMRPHVIMCEMVHSSHGHLQKATFNLSMNSLAYRITLITWKFIFQWDNLSNIGFITVCGLNAGHIKQILSKKDGMIYHTAYQFYNSSRASSNYGLHIYRNIGFSGTKI